ncbi:MAG: hypothetical protein NC453_16415 [Muribaculum sp.]|nr:hypothetical protein [Muribaculum sp.]
MNIIDKTISTEKTRENVRKAIPVLIHWAQTGQTHHFYGDLSVAIGKQRRFSNIAYILGRIQDVIDETSKVLGFPIPTLNALVNNEEKNLPSDGFNYVEPGYSGLTKEGKRNYVDGFNQKACEFKHWNLVLDTLELEPLKFFTENEIDQIAHPSISSTQSGEGGEHKAMKELISKNPLCVGLSDIEFTEIEHLLPSGDRLDIYLESKKGERIAVEVKPSNSDDSDITRGIFQCIKYKSVLEALSKADGSNAPVKTILVAARTFSDIHKRLIDVLGVQTQYIQSMPKK